MGLARVVARVPEGAGPVNPVELVFLLFDLSVAVLRRFWARRGEALGSRIARRATAKRPKVLDAHAGRRTLLKAEKKVGAAPGYSVMCGRVRAPAPVARLVDRPPSGAVGHSFAARGGMECCDGIAVGEVNQRGRPRRVPGVMTRTTCAHRGSRALMPEVRPGRRSRAPQAADVPSRSP